MIKTVFPFAGVGVQIARLVDVHSRGVDRGWMQKRAAVLTKEISNVRPEKGHSFIHAISMGCQEAYGPNRNGDGFNEKSARFEFPEPEKGGPKSRMLDGGLTQYHNTFTKYAKVYKDHVNKDPALASGEILAEAYNPDMRRGELLIKVQNDKWAPELEKSANGEDIPFSMSCFPAGTLVRTRFGFKPIEEVKRGEEVLTHRGHFRRVGNCSTRSAAALVVLSFKGYGADTLKLTPNHEVYAVRFEDIPKGSHKGRAQVSKPFRRKHRATLAQHLRWVPAAELTEQHYMAVPVRHEVGANVSIRDARLWGYYLAEGSLGAFNGQKASCVQFTVGLGDDLRSEVHDLADWTSVSDREHNLTANARRLDCIGTAIAEQLRVVVGRANGKRIPEQMFAARYSAKLAFASAWLNADGWQDSDGLHWSMASAGRTRSFDLQQLLASMGIPASVHSIDHPEDRGIIKNAEREYVVNVSNAFSDIFASVSKAEVIKKRRCPMSVFISEGYLMVPVKRAVRQSIPTTVFNFSVDDDETYTVMQLAVHNCRVPYDTCSICGHQAANRKEYCNHLKNEMGQVKAGGHQVFANNDRPMFFDYSGVFRPADRIAYGLRKVASTGEMPEEFIPSTMLAEQWGVSAPKSVLFDSSPYHVQEKLAAMERLAAMEKQIEATGSAVSPEVDTAAKTKSLDDGVGSELRGLDFNEMMGALSQAKICLPVKDFFRLILGNKYDSVAGEMDDVESLLPGIFSKMLNTGDGVEDVTGMRTYDPATSLLPKRIRDLIGNVAPDMSLGEGPVGRRVQISIIQGGGPVESAKSAHVKSASDNKVANFLAKQYVAYQLAFSQSLGGKDGGLADRLMLRRNYV